MTDTQRHSSARDHRQRFDATVCPDPDGCVRLYHHQLLAGETCDCCGIKNGSDDEVTVAGRYMVTAYMDTGEASSKTVTGSAAVDRHVDMLAGCDGVARVTVRDMSGALVQYDVEEAAR